MSEPIAIQAPQPSSTGSSRIGTAGFAIGIAIVALVVVAAVVGNALVPQDPFTQDLGNRLKPPFWMEGTQAGHLLGTDQYGRDLLWRAVGGVGIAFLIGAGVTIVVLVLGLTLGSVAGYYGRKTDMAITGLIDLAWGFPLLLVARSMPGEVHAGQVNRPKSRPLLPTP